ncbi:MAG: S-layer homology domain-containing protein [Oscillospiraceae bacterium]|nr:S-layer homology domain-containing protein [Oscillospiraceae bacterium]
MKKLLSLILTTAMLISFLPTVAFAEDTREEVIYSFLEADYTGLKPDGITYANSNNTLQWVGTTSTNKTKYGWEAGYAFFNIPVGKYAAYKMNIPAKGEYVARLDYICRAAGSVADMYIIQGTPDDIDAAIASATPVFENINFHSTTDKEKKYTTVIFNAETAGEYLMVWVGKDNSVSYAVRPMSLKLTPYTKPVYAETVHTMTDTEIVGRDITFTSHILMSDGERFIPSAEGDGIKAFSETEDTVEIVSESMTDGVYTVTFKTLKTGVAKIKLVSTVEGTPYESVHTLNVIEQPPLSPVDIEMTQDTMRFTDKTAPSETWETDGFELVLEGNKMTTSIARYTPRVIKDPQGKTKYFVQLDTGTKIWPTAANAMFTIRKRIFTPGYYNVSYKGVMLKNTGDYSIYVNGEYAGDFVSNDPNATDAAANLYTKEKSLNTLYLPEGYVEISFRARKIYSGSAFFVPHTVSLVPIEVQEAPEISKVELAISEKIAEGESEDITARVLMSDGTYRHFGLDNEGKADDDNKVIEVISDNPEIIDISEVSFMNIGTSDEIKFKAEAKGVGNTNIRIKVKVDGEEYTEVVPVSGMEYPVLERVDVALERKNIPATRKTEASITLTRSEDGKPYTDEYSVRYESSDTDIATVDEETGEITGQNPGRATIYAYVTDWAGNTVTGSAEIVIAAKPVLNEIKASVDTQLVTGQSKKITVTGQMDDGIPADMEDYVCAFESTDDSVVSVSEDGTVTAVGEGEAAISVTAKNELSKNCSHVIIISVSDDKWAFEVDFSKTQTDESNRGVLHGTPGYTIIEREDTTNYYRIFTFPDTKQNVLQIFTQAKDKRMWPETSDPKGATFAFNVDVSDEGFYGLELFGGLWEGSPTYSLFVDENYVGDHSFHEVGAVQKTDSGKQLNTVYLSEGTHSIRFRLRKKDKDLPYMYVRKLVFSPREDAGFEKIEVELPNELAIGESVSGTARVKMRDGSIRHFGPDFEGNATDEENKFTLDVSNDSVEASGFEYQLGNSAERDFTITAVKEGTVEVTFTATIDGVSYPLTFDIEVKDDPLVSTGVDTEATELLAGDATYIFATPKLSSGRILGASCATSTFESLDTDVATIEGDLLRTHKPGIARIKTVTTFNGVQVEGISEIEVLEEGLSDIVVTAGGSEYIRLTDEGDTVPVYVAAYDNLGREIDAENCEISAISLTPEYATLDSDNNIIPVSEGEAKFDVTVKVDGRIREKEVTLTVVYGKAKSTYYTPEKIEAVRENYKKYSWVKSEGNAYIKNADIYVDKLDEIYDLIPSEGLPRAICIGNSNDPLAYTCRYCNTNVMEKYGQFSWKHNALNDPWKIQCPECKRRFPSNDFGSFYKLGLDEYGEFSRDRALNEHAKLFGDLNAEVGSDAYYGYGKGYLENTLYKDVASEPRLNGGVGLRPGETVATWGVDDGWGYVPKDENGKPYENDGNIERHTYIAEYIHLGLWRRQDSSDANGGLIQRAIGQCARAYLYTGDIKYGKVAAVLLDRIADFYPDYDIALWSDFAVNTDGGLNIGKTMGCIWECEEVVKRAEVYDIVFDAYDDPSVISYINNKAQNIKMRHAKNTAAQIRTNIEDGFLRTALSGLVDCSVSGNFGLPQEANAIAAVVLDTMPETAKWLDYLMAPGWIRSNTSPCLGGGVSEVLVNTIDADGQGDEASQYNINWHTALADIQNILDNYDRYDKVNLYNNPKFVQMFYSNISLMSTYYSPQIGDTGTTQGKGHWITKNTAVEGWRKLRDPLFAQVVYKLNGNTVDGLRYSSYEKDPERLADEIQEVIDTYGPLDLKSEMMTNFGFGILRAGGDYTYANSDTAKETSRNIWMYFGKNTDHGHVDTLNLGMTAFGLDFMPDLGYPALTGTDHERYQWTRTTLSHNSVVVNKKEQTETGEIRGKIKHFDDAGFAKLMDVSADYSYESTEQYRRSVMMIEVDDENAYTVDFFRVLGGNSHLYSFHATSNEISGTEGLNLTPQTDENGNYIGTYAGADVPFGPDAAGTHVESQLENPIGFTWLKNVDRDAEPSDVFEVNFKIKDFNKQIKDANGLYLHMTVHNEGNSEKGSKTNVAIAEGLPPQASKNKNVDKLKYLLIENEGENLDTVFTTVFEPYRNNRYLKSSEELSPVIVGGVENSGDAKRVIKVTHESGRCDYIFWATNNTVTYKLTDGDVEILFRGFMGVYTLNSDGENIYRYVHDGDIIGEETDTKVAVEGVIKRFTKELSENNKITIIPTETVTDEELSSLAGRYVFIDNGASVRSGTYAIKGAERSGEDIVLDVGRITAIRRYKDSNDLEKGYDYMISEGQSVRIPLSMSDDFAPEFEAVSDSLSASAGSSVSLRVRAESELSETVTYLATTLPRGASLDSETGAITWTPDSSQVGKNHFAITASDESGRSTTVHFYITVYGSTSGGGGGGATAPSDKPSTDVGEDIILPPAEPDVRFTDLGNHAWAEDAINSLADKGIIKGTSETTYSPANNITRADFAILLVRAFKKESDNTENFDDVNESDYFARELAVARNTGLVGGVGDNKFAPRDNIKRCDMMLMVYRVIKDKFVGADIILPEYEDFDSVPDYAKEAVSALIGAGLVNGKNNKIAPNDNTTRAEVAVLLQRVLEFVAEK